MKKSTFAVLLAVALPLAVSAQNSVGSFSVTPKVGANLANISGAAVWYLSGNGDKKMKGKYNTRLAAGVDVEYRAHEILGVMLGVAYSQQGCQYSNHESLSNAFSDMHENMDYIQIPLMLRAHFGQGISAGVGVQMGVLLSDKIIYNVEDITTDNEGKVIYTGEKEVKDDHKWSRRKTDFSIPIGVAYEYNNVVVDARYSFGLSNLYKGDDFNAEKSRVFTFTVGYRFQL